MTVVTVVTVFRGGAPLYTDKPNDQKNLLDNRELGIINIGGEGTVTVDGKKYTLGFQEALYVGRGAKNIEVSSKDAAKPAKFYMLVYTLSCLSSDKAEEVSVLKIRQYLKRLWVETQTTQPHLGR